MVTKKTHPIDMLCEELGITKYRLAKTMGVKYSSIHSLVSRNTKIENMNVETLKKIATAINLSLEKTYIKLKNYEK